MEVKDSKTQGRDQPRGWVRRKRGANVRADVQEPDSRHTVPDEQALVAEGECTISADHAAPGREMMIAASGAPYRAATGGEKITMDASSPRRFDLR